MQNWQDVVRFACSFPDVTMVPFYGAPCPKVNGKAIVAPGREDGSFALFTGSVDEKLMLIETDPATFWQTDHYRDYATVLVRYGTDARDRVETYIARRWWGLCEKGAAAGVG